MIYPASIYTSASFAGSTFTVNVDLPATQTLKGRSSCNKPPMMANCASLSDDGHKGKVQFKSICGILGFQMTGDADKGNFSSVSFKGAGACGAGTLTCTGGVGSALVPNLTMTFANLQQRSIRPPRVTLQSHPGSIQHFRQIL
ncbi:MAG: hypothetical protein IJU69_05660 [Bacteroidales bacterium]|nr:hypothetical protein [Bacteroidales bacterium]